MGPGLKRKITGHLDQESKAGYGLIYGPDEEQKNQTFSM